MLVLKKVCLHAVCLSVCVCVCVCVYVCVHAGVLPLPALSSYVRGVCSSMTQWTGWETDKCLCVDRTLST